MSKKSKKSSAAPAQGESFFNEGAANANAATPNAAPVASGTGATTEAGPVVLKRKRSYKPRAKVAAAKAEGGMSHQDAYQAGFKAGVKFAKMGA